MNPFHKILADLPDKDTAVTLPYLDTVRKHMQEGKVELPRYSDVVEVLQFLNSNGVLTLTETSIGSFSIKKKEINV